MWRTGLLVNAPEVRTLHGLRSDELLMGWLYVGSVDDELRGRIAESPRKPLDPAPFLAALPG